MHHRLTLSTTRGLQLAAAMALLGGCSEADDTGALSSTATTNPSTEGTDSAMSTAGTTSAPPATMSATTTVPPASNPVPPQTNPVPPALNPMPTPNPSPAVTATATASSTSTAMEGTGGAPNEDGMAGASPTSSGGDTSGEGGEGGTPEGNGGETAAGGMSGAGGSDDGGGEAGSDDGGGDFVLPTEPNSVAYIGCSMAWNIGNGYKRVGGQVMWNSDSYQTSAMVVQNWTDPGSSSWNLFDQKMNSIGGIDTVKAIMIQICIFSSRATDEELRSMISSAREHVNPGTHIFMVGQPQYEVGHDCSLAGAGGAQWTDEQAQALANDSSVNENLTYLGKFMLDSSAGEVSSDTCHASSSGEDELGRQAMAFFGG
jgi:hypothetical protein